MNNLTLRHAAQSTLHPLAKRLLRSAAMVVVPHVPRYAPSEFRAARYTLAQYGKYASLDTWYYHQFAVEAAPSAAGSPATPVIRGRYLAGYNYGMAQLPYGWLEHAVTTGFTVAMRMRKRDTTLRPSSAFGNGAPGNRINAHVPDNVGTVYFDYPVSAGYERCTWSWSSNTARYPLTDWHTWVFVCRYGHQAEIWIDGQLVSTAAISETAITGTYGAMSFCGNTAFGATGNTYGDSDDSDYAFFGFWNRAFNQGESHWLSKNGAAFSAGVAPGAFTAPVSGLYSAGTLRVTARKAFKGAILPLNPRLPVIR